VKAIPLIFFIACRGASKTEIAPGENAAENAAETETATKTAAPKIVEASVYDAPPSPLLARAPEIDASCRAPFSTGYKFKSGDFEVLMRAIYGNRSHPTGPPGDAEAAKMSGARCYLPPPHEGLHFENWCCL